jgi:urease accessory protein
MTDGETLSATADSRNKAASLKLVRASRPGPDQPRLQRSQGEIRLGFKQGVNGRTALDDFYQQGCMKARLPRQIDATHEAVLINTAGGLTGGDEIRVSANFAAGTNAVITTQACERIYKASAGSAQVSSRLAVAKGARARWLPQETIIFEGASLSRRMHADLEDGAHLLACESVILGRPAMGEYVHCARLTDEWIISINGRPAFIDRLGLDGDLSAELNRAGVGNGARCYASVMAAGPGITRQCETARQLIAANGLPGGASNLGSVMLVRLLAPNSHELRAVLLPLLEALGEAPLPRVWRM